MATVTKATIIISACFISLCFFYHYRQLALANSALKKKVMPGNPRIEYTSYMFAQEWTPNVCAVNKCIEPVPKTREFNIHGLWPQNDSKDNLTKCTTTKVKFSQLNAEL